ncbi:hypothetical protein JTB14_030210 [Gonioctena quinquepunctata]|nr:hypothetical protein JTB14_030210 [Gonioctena quinquepunctata]
MVHKYNRKSNQQAWEEDCMKAAINAVRKGSNSINAAAKNHHIPVATLFRRFKKPENVALKKGLGRFWTVFTSEQENILVEYILTMESRLFGLTISDLKYLAFQFAEHNKIANNFNQRDKKAGKERGF